VLVLAQLVAQLLLIDAYSMKVQLLIDLQQAT
jgi:hypothetical protein